MEVVVKRARQVQGRRARLAAAAVSSAALALSLLLLVQHEESRASSGAAESLLESKLRVISVTVPPGLQGGDNMQFKSGSFGLYAATIPSGLQPGQTFQVEVPSGDDPQLQGQVSDAQTSALYTGPGVTRMRQVSSLLV